MFFLGGEVNFIISSATRTQGQWKVKFPLSLILAFFFFNFSIINPDKWESHDIAILKSKPLKLFTDKTKALLQRISKLFQNGLITKFDEQNCNREGQVLFYIMCFFT